MKVIYLNLKTGKYQNLTAKLNETEILNKTDSESSSNDGLKFLAQPGLTDDI